MQFVSYGGERNEKLSFSGKPTLLFNYLITANENIGNKNIVLDLFKNFNEMLNLIVLVIAGN